MKKNNNKGFMLLETMVVSAFIITTLIFLYIQFSNLRNSYISSFKYDSIPELFKTKEIDKFINENYGYNDLLEGVKNSEHKYIELYDGTCNLTYFSKHNTDCNRIMRETNVKTALLVSTNLSSTINYLKHNKKYSNGLYVYMKKINQATDNHSYSLIVEFEDNKYTNLVINDGKVIVTFDANGGTVSETSKEVVPEGLYGTLPTPTKEGYTFKGWHGKNKFDNNSEPLSSSTYITGSGGTSAHHEYSIYKVNINPNTSYVITNSGKSTAPGFAIFDSSDNRIDGQNYQNRDNVVFTTPENASYIVFSVVTNSTYRYDKDTFQLEEGSRATEYEPYFVTKDTTVVQVSNHTLTAIWEENS